MKSKTLTEVQAFISQHPVPMFIGGKWISSAKTFEVKDPGLGQTMAHVAEGDAKEIDQAVDAAAHAFKKTNWASMPASERSVYLHRLADLIDKHRHILAQIESLNVGKTLPLAEGDVNVAAQTFRYFADLSLHVQMKRHIPVSQYDAYTILQPYGVCGFVLPWNFPLLLAAWGIAPALSAGNTVVIKPAENTPLSTLYLCKLIQEAGIPDGVVNVVPGFGEKAGAALSKNPKLKRMSFTGSPETGRLIAAACGANLVPVKLELGGKGAAIVMDDVNVDEVAKELATIITCNTGQMCCTASRWLVQEKIYKEFVEKVTEYLKKTSIGYSLDAKAYMGPVVSEIQRKNILHLLEKGEKGGAKCLLKAKAMTVPGCEGGYFISPGLLEGTSENICAQKEIFGPISFLIPFKTEKEAIDIVHTTPYGLGNSVWASDPQKAERIAESLVAGINWINTHNAVPLGVPYAGYNLSGLGGGVNSLHTLMDYFRLSSIVRPRELVIAQGA